MARYVIARTARNRPTLQHKVGPSSRIALCGVSLTGWSLYYSDRKFGPLLCKRCERINP